MKIYDPGLDGQCRLMRHIVYLVLALMLRSVSAHAGEVQHSAQYLKLLTKDGPVEAIYDVRTEAPALKTQSELSLPPPPSIPGCSTWFKPDMMVSLFRMRVWEVTTCTGLQVGSATNSFSMDPMEGDVAWEILSYLDVRSKDGNFQGSCALARAYWIGQDAVSAFLVPTGIYQSINCSVKG